MLAGSYVIYTTYRSWSPYGSQLSTRKLDYPVEFACGSDGSVFVCHAITIPASFLWPADCLWWSMQYPTSSEGAAPQMQLYISSDIDLIIMFFKYFGGPIQLGISPGFGLIWSQVLPHGIEVSAIISQFLLYLREAICDLTLSAGYCTRTECVIVF